jgi:hypothetical protein
MTVAEDQNAQETPEASSAETGEEPEATGSGETMAEDAEQTGQAEGAEPEAEGGAAPDEPGQADAGEAEGEGAEGEQGSRLKHAAIGAAAGAAIGGAVVAAKDMLSDRGGGEGIKDTARQAGEKAKETAHTVKDKLPGGASQSDQGMEDQDEEETTPAA